MQKTDDTETPDLMLFRAFSLVLKQGFDTIKVQIQCAELVDVTITCRLLTMIVQYNYAICLRHAM